MRYALWHWIFRSSLRLSHYHRMWSHWRRDLQRRPPHHVRRHQMENHWVCRAYPRISSEILQDLEEEGEPEHRLLHEKIDGASK